MASRYLLYLTGIYVMRYGLDPRPLQTAEQRLLYRSVWIPRTPIAMLAFLCLLVDIDNKYIAFY